MELLTTDCCCNVETLNLASLRATNANKHQNTKQQYILEFLIILSKMRLLFENLISDYQTLWKNRKVIDMHSWEHWVSIASMCNTYSHSRRSLHQAAKLPVYKVAFLIYKKQLSFMGFLNLVSGTITLWAKKVLLVVNLTKYFVLVFRCIKSNAGFFIRSTFIRNLRLKLQKS